MFKLSLAKFRGFLIGFLLSCFLLWLSPKVFGVSEPWDASSAKLLMYLLLLFLIGVIGSAMSRQSYWHVALGTFIGQLVFIIIILGGGPLIFVGAIYTAIYSIATLAGGWVYSFKPKCGDKIKLKE